MNGGERLVGFGIALVDEKVQIPNLTLPPEDELVAFIDQQTPIARVAGGITPNIMTALTEFSQNQNTRLLACTGDDTRGIFYRSNTHNRLGTIQINPHESTGVVIEVLDEKGQVVNFGWKYGAAETVKAEKAELDQKNMLFISDLTVLRLPGMFNEADKMLGSVESSGGNFFLNLAGLHPLIDSKDNIDSVLRDLRKGPDIVTGNESEFAYLTESSDMNAVIEHAFPKARAVVITLGKQGSLIRFEGEVFHMPSYIVPEEQVIDVTGAGDAYAGIMLGGLYTKPYNQWTREHVLKACDTASFGAAIAVQSTNSRLTSTEMLVVQNHYLQNLPQ